MLPSRGITGAARVSGAAAPGAAPPGGSPRRNARKPASRNQNDGASASSASNFGSDNVSASAGGTAPGAFQQCLAAASASVAFSESAASPSAASVASASASSPLGAGLRSAALIAAFAAARRSAVHAAAGAPRMPSSSTTFTSVTAQGMCARACASFLSASPPPPAANRFAKSISAGHGALTRRSKSVSSGLASKTRCSVLDSRTVPTSPRVSRATSATSRARHASSSLARVFISTRLATTTVKSLKKSGFWSTTASTDSSTNAPATDVFSSCRCAATAAARPLPRSDSCTKKLFPRSRGVTSASSTSVNECIPPSTRFLIVSTPVGPQCSKHTLHDSSRAWPCSPQMRSWRSYRRRLASSIACRRERAGRARPSAPRQRATDLTPPEKYVAVQFFEIFGTNFAFRRRATIDERVASRTRRAPQNPLPRM